MTVTLRIAEVLHLIRVQQWYKNLVVFLALFFSGNLFHFPLFYIIVLTFFSFCFISSAGYIINDLADRKMDRLHPERKKRPLAAGTIPISTAVVMAILLFLAGMYLAWKAGMPVVYLAMALFMLTQLYTFWLKRLVLVDVLTIATLFVIRAIAGAVAIKVTISPWLILVPFFLSLFLSVGKRQGDLMMLKEQAGPTRRVLEQYTTTLTHSLMIMSTTLLIISYALYSFLSPYNRLLYTLPFALFIIFRFFYLIMPFKAQKT